MCQQASVCTPRYSNPPKSRRRCAEVTLFSELTGLGGFNEATFHVLVAGNALFLFVVVATLVAALSDGLSQKLPTPPDASLGWLSFREWQMPPTSPKCASRSSGRSSTIVESSATAAAKRGTS